MPPRAGTWARSIRTRPDEPGLGMRGDQRVARSMRNCGVQSSDGWIRPVTVTNARRPPKNSRTSLVRSNTSFREPRPPAGAERPEVHRVDRVLRAGDRVDHRRHEHRSDLRTLPREPLRAGGPVEAADPLGVDGGLEVGGQRRQEAEGEVDAEREPVGHAQPPEGRRRSHSGPTQNASGKPIVTIARSADRVAAKAIDSAEIGRAEERMWNRRGSRPAGSRWTSPPATIVFTKTMKLDEHERRSPSSAGSAATGSRPSGSRGRPAARSSEHEPQVPHLEDGEDEEGDDEDEDAGVAAGEPRPPAEIARGDVHGLPRTRALPAELGLHRLPGVDQDRDEDDRRDEVADDRPACTRSSGRRKSYAAG